MSVSWLLKKVLTKENLSARLHKPQIIENTQKYCSTATAICRQSEAIINTVHYTHKSPTQAHNCGKNCSGGTLHELHLTTNQLFVNNILHI
jgi:hypothetical protein